MTTHLEALWIERNVVETMQNDTIEQIVAATNETHKRDLIAHLMFLTIRHEYVSRLVELESAYVPPKSYIRRFVEKYNL